MRSRQRPWVRSLSGLAVGLTVSWATIGSAQTLPDVPPDLSQTLDAIDAAAGQEDLPGVLQHYSNDFTSTDGGSYRTLERSLEAFWQQYSDLRYETIVNSVTQDGSATVAETTTTITGTQTQDSRTFSLTATIRSRQRFDAGHIVQQEILAERSQLTTGDNPPTVSVSLPEEVPTSREFSFDAIVQEPLGDRYLLGAVIEEPVTTSLSSLPTLGDLELLSAGGLFKVGRAPASPGDRWISAVLVRDDGITIVTQRLRVVSAN